MNVMLIDDDDLVRDILSEGLRDAGLGVVSFSDPQIALDTGRSTGPPDVIVTDVDLGAKLNGFDVSACAHGFWPSVLVVLISGLPEGSTGHVLDSRDRYLQKPIPNSLLLNTINELSNGRPSLA